MYLVIKQRPHQPGRLFRVAGLPGLWEQDDHPGLSVTLHAPVFLRFIIGIENENHRLQHGIQHQLRRGYPEYGNRRGNPYRTPSPRRTAGFDPSLGQNPSRPAAKPAHPSCQGGWFAIWFWRALSTAACFSSRTSSAALRAAGSASVFLAR